MKISKIISSKAIKDFIEIKALNSDKKPTDISNKIYGGTIAEAINILNNEVNESLKINKFNIELEKAKIKISDKVTKSYEVKVTKSYEVIGAKNIFTALLLEGCLNIDINVDKRSINEILDTFQHEKFIHVPESLHYLSSEVVYEDENYYVVFIKDAKIFKAIKI